jgi:hypothetical protein
LLDEFVAKFPDHPRAMMARILSERIGKTTDVAHEPVLPAEAGIPFVPPEGMAISSKQPRTRDENKPNADNYPLRLALIILGLLIAFTAVLGAPAWIHLLKY